MMMQSRFLKNGVELLVDNLYQIMNYSGGVKNELHWCVV